MAIIHFTPQIMVPPSVLPLDLVDVKCEELGLALQNGREITVRRPWPNKHYRVVCRKVGRKALLGLRAERPSIPTEFTVVTRWALAADDLLIHTVRYVVLDQDFDLVSDQISMWRASACRRYKTRWPAESRHWSPVELQPCMSLVPYKGRGGRIVEKTGLCGLLERRHETLFMHTLERGRFETWSFAGRLPGPESAF